MSEVLLSQLAYAELISPKPEATVQWMIDVLGLEETERDGQSVYLRGWAEWLHSSLIVTEGKEPGLGRVGWRTYGPGDPELVAKRMEGAGTGVGWVGERPGRGAAYQYRAPFGGHLHEVFWEVDRYQAPPEMAEPHILNRPQRNPNRGAQARYIDHVTIASPNMVEDIAFYKTLGQRHTSIMHVEPGFNVFATMTANGIRPTHDLGLVPDFSGATGRVNHIAFRVDQRLDVERAAEAFMSAGTDIEFGPGIHGIDEITYLYVREPGGVRIEINAGGWVNAEPDFEAKDWHVSQAGTTLWRTLQMPQSMMECWPPVGGEQAEQGDEGFQSTELFVPGS
jgi:catechol 2,3-dioxygenase